MFNFMFTTIVMTYIVCVFSQFNEMSYLMPFVMLSWGGKRCTKKQTISTVKLPRSSGL